MARNGGRRLFAAVRFRVPASPERKGTFPMSNKSIPPASTDALCAYEECRFCTHRMNVSRTPDGEGQCGLEMQGRAKVSLCRGRLFFTVSPDGRERYKHWVLSGSPRAKHTPKETSAV